MKPEVSERLLIEELVSHSLKKNKIDKEEIRNIERLTGDASTRRYYRVFCKNTSYVVCLDNPSDEENSFVKVQKFLNENKIRVPKIYDLDISKGYILEEDLGDLTLLQKLSQLESAEDEYQTYKVIIDELLKIHKISNKTIVESKKFDLKFDYEKLKFEIDFTIKYFLRLFLKVEDEELLKKISEEFDPICKRLASEKMVLTHRDFHSRNIMVQNEDYIIIDFQDARYGIPQYDLASLLDDCYYQLCPDNKEKLLHYYYSNLDEETHGQESFENFMNLYSDMAIQRVFKAIGSFTYIYNHRKDERYLKYIGFAMEKLKSFMVRSSKYKNLRKELFGIYYES